MMIIHQTENLTLRLASGRLEICLEGNTHAVVVGHPASVTTGRKTMERLERYPAQLRSFMQHR